MGASWVIPRKVDKMVLISAQFSFEENDGYFLLQVDLTTRQGRTGYYWLEEENDGWFLGDSYD